MTYYQFATLLLALIAVCGVLRTVLEHPLRVKRQRHIRKTSDE